MKRLIFLTVALSTSTMAGEAQVPTGVPGDWTLVPGFSDEFDGARIDGTKWRQNVAPWGERAWRQENVVQKNGVVTLTAKYEPHKNQGKDYFYTMGILQSEKCVTYGFFEARIKACDRYPGICPAFWLFSQGGRNPKFPHVTYSEVDIVELLQGNFIDARSKEIGPRHIDCNLHARILDENGKEVWRRPHQMPEVCEHKWEAPWDPRKEFHIYGAEVSPEKIVWYIDGKKVAEAPNLYWHLPMHIALTVEARPPLIRWAGEEGRIPNLEGITKEGFPTHMTVDYVRSWVRKK